MWVVFARKVLFQSFFIEESKNNVNGLKNLEFCVDVFAKVVGRPFTDVVRAQEWYKTWTKRLSVNSRVNLFSDAGSWQREEHHISSRNLSKLAPHLLAPILNVQTSHFVKLLLVISLRGAWTDRDTNDIFAHCSLIFYFLDFKFSNFVCLSELHPSIWFFFKNSFRKKKKIQKNTQNALAPSIFIVLAIVLKLGTPLLHTQAQNTLLQNF